MNLSFINLFFTLSIFQLLLISVYLLANRNGNRISHGLLACFFLSIGLNLIDTSLQFNRAYNATPGLAFWGSCMPLLFGPSLFLYVQSVLVKGFVFEKSKW